MQQSLSIKNQNTSTCLQRRNVWKTPALLACLHVPRVWGTYRSDVWQKKTLGPTCLSLSSWDLLWYLCISLWFSCLVWWNLGSGWLFDGALYHTNMFENPLDITNYRSLGYVMFPPTLETSMPRRCFSPFTSLFVPEATLHGNLGAFDSGLCISWFPMIPATNSVYSVYVSNCLHIYIYIYRCVSGDIRLLRLRTHAKNIQSQGMYCTRLYKALKSYTNCRISFQSWNWCPSNLQRQFV